MADEPVKRVNYFKYQFLNAEDFVAEQSYHRGMRYRHNRALHSPGVADGLDVTRSETDETSVVVSPGIAIDGDGKEMVILGEQAVSLSHHPDGDDVYVTIQFDDHPSDPVTSTATPGDMRMFEEPVIASSTSAPTGTLQILLARVERVGKNVDNVDQSTRAVAGAVPRADQILSRQIKEADGITGQNTEIGSGIKAAHIQDAAVTTAKVAPDAVTSGNVAPADGTSGQDVNNGAGIKTGHLQDAAVTGAKVADNSVPGTKLVDNSVPGPKLTDNSVGGAKLVNNSVAGVKLADNTVAGTKLADNSVSGAKLTDNTVPGTKLTDNSVPGTKVTDNSVSGTKLVDKSVPGTKLSDNSVSGAALVDNTVTGAKLADSTVPGTKLADNTVSGAKLADNTVSGTKLADNTVAGTKLANNSITGVKIQDGSVAKTELDGFTANSLVGGFCAVGSTGNVLNGHNILSVTKSGVGQYTVNWKIPLDPFGPVFAMAFSNRTARVMGTSANQVVINILDAAGGFADGTWYLIAFATSGAE